VRDHLNAEQPARTLALSAEERHAADPLRLLTAKPVLYVANVGEQAAAGTDDPRVRAVADFAAAEGSATVPVCAKIEDEIAGLEPADAELFLRDLGLAEPSLQRLARATAQLLGLVSFFTFNEQEARAWTIRRGATAVEAAGQIHTDFAKHFIRAEVTPYADFDRFGGEKGAREHGRLRVEGRDYVVRDGDVIYFRVGA
jgi:ribosome-binding ATPase YchF (GTP1/OBG family)